MLVIVYGLVRTKEHFGGMKIRPSDLFFQFVAKECDARRRGKGRTLNRPRLYPSEVSGD